MLPRRESRWNLQRCPKLANRSQMLVGWSWPYYMWTRYRCLTIFFRLSIHASTAKIQPDIVVRWCQNGDFLCPVFSASRVQHISGIWVAEDVSVWWLGPRHFVTLVRSASINHLTYLLTYLLMHSKFALRPHHVWKYGRHPISERWD